MRQSVGQGERRVAALQGLVRIAKGPECHGRIAEAPCPGILPVEEGMRAVLLRIVEGDTLLQVGQGRDELAKTEQAISQGPIALQTEGRVVLALPQGKEFLCHFPGGLQVTSHFVKSP